MVQSWARPTDPPIVTWRHNRLTPDDPLIYTTVSRVHENSYILGHANIHAHTLGHTHTYKHSIWQWKFVFYTHTHTHTHTHMNTFCINIAIVELIKYIKLFFFQVLAFFCEISRIYVACANLCFIILELTPDVLGFEGFWRSGAKGKAVLP